MIRKTSIKKYQYKTKKKRRNWKTNERKNKEWIKRIKKNWYGMNERNKDKSIYKERR